MKLLNSVPEIDAVSAGLAIRNGIAIETDDLIVYSGFAGVDFETNAISEGPFEKHARDSIHAYKTILAAQGLTLDNVVKVRCFLQNPSDYAVWNAIFQDSFTAPYPCRTTVGAPLIVGLIELEFTAARTTRQAATLMSL